MTFRTYGKLQEFFREGVFRPDLEILFTRNTAPQRCGWKKSMAIKPAAMTQAANRRGGAEAFGRASSTLGRDRRVCANGINFRSYCRRVQAVRIAAKVPAKISGASGIWPAVRIAPASVAASTKKNVRTVFIGIPWFEDTIHPFSPESSGKPRDECENSVDVTASAQNKPSVPPVCTSVFQP